MVTRNPQWQIICEFVNGPPTLPVQTCVWPCAAKDYRKGPFRSLLQTRTPLSGGGRLMGERDNKPELGEHLVCECHIAIICLSWRTVCNQLSAFESSESSSISISYLVRSAHFLSLRWLQRTSTEVDHAHASFMTAVHPSMVLHGPINWASSWSAQDPCTDLGPKVGGTAVWNWESEYSRFGTN